MIAKRFFPLPIDLSEKSQTQLSADALIVRLIGATIVRDIYTVPEIALYFPRWTKIAEAVEVDDVVSSLSVGDPMSSLPRRVVQVDDAALFAARFRRKRVSHKHASEVRYTRTNRRSTQFLVRGRACREGRFV